MDNKKVDNLVKILEKSNTWIPSSSLSKMIGVSERTIRNYITEINNSNECIVESSKNGYRLKKTSTKEATAIKDTDLNKRVYYTLSKLLASNHGISLFDLAEDLIISESTVLNTLLPQLKKIISSFNLKVESRNYMLFLNGSEQNKRKLIGFLVTDNNYGYFTASEVLKELFPSYNIQEIMEGLYTTCKDSDLFLNNFALNNLLIHILIILIRLQSKDSLGNTDENKDINTLLLKINQKDKIINLANRISDFFKKIYYIQIPEKDYNQILVLIILSIDHDFSNLHDLIAESFSENVKVITKELSKRYNIPEFDNDFIAQFSLHMFNVKERYKYKISYPNPIAKQIKLDYAPIYDMAVYFVHEFSKIYHITLSEDEIAFIAFHLGAYLENNKQISSITTCIIIAENYHDITKRIVQQVEEKFTDELAILDIISYDFYMMTKPTCDILITTLDIPVVHEHKIAVNPILTASNIDSIREELSLISSEKQVTKARIFLRNLFKNELYFRNIQLDKSEDYIDFMGKQCIKKNYIDKKFIQDVLLRESISSTAFTDHLAVPHSISKYAKKSFICVIHNDSPIPWGNSKVNFILMIGISEPDMKYFKDALDLLIDLFLDLDITLKILNTKSFDEFLSMF